VYAESGDRLDMKKDGLKYVASAIIIHAGAMVYGLSELASSQSTRSYDGTRIGVALIIGGAAILIWTYWSSLPGRDDRE